MRNNYLLLWVLALLFVGTNVQAQIYVNQAAGGSNDGSSWANAYTDLSDAIAATVPGDQLWVAQGTYKPGGTAPSVDASFVFPHDLGMYGGFAGTETELSERDWATNETILSGDINGDDSETDININRTDNVKHVISLTDTVTAASAIDGFTIRNGNTVGADGSGDDRRGGGMLTYGNPSVRNCDFTQNFGHFGGGLYPRGTDPIVIENCDFFLNASSSSGAGIYINSVSAIVTDCNFDNNTTQSRGGGMYSGNCNITVDNCSFTNNSAPESSGGGMHLTNGADDPPIIGNLTNCTFSNNNSIFGGALSCYQGSVTANITNSDFIGNSSVNVGGAITNAFGVTTNIDNCLFSENECDGSGGAIYSQNDENVITVSNTDIVSNAADVGGGINMSGDNEASVGLALPTLNLDKVTFITNVANSQGGGLNIGNANGTFTNTLFDTNFAVDPDGSIGGAISINTSDSINSVYTIINSTIAGNSAGIGAGISHWEPGELSSSVLNLQNTILSNELGANYQIEDGDPVLVSLGGNLSTDATIVAELSAMNDLNEVDPMFVNPDDMDYHLQDGSPAIDAAIAAAAPATDIEGNDRVNEPDMGAYENQTMVGTNDQRRTFGASVVFPNPAQDELKFTFTSVWQGRLDIRVSDLSGKLILQQQLDKNGREVFHSVDIRQLPQGMYNLTISNGKLVNTSSFVKE